MTLTWREYAADVPRFVGASRNLLIEGQRTNLIRNPRAEGITVGTVGSGGVGPTNWTVTPSAGGTMVVNGIVVANGLPCLDITITAATPSPAHVIRFDTVTAAASTSYVLSVFIQRVGGDFTAFTNSNFRRRINAATVDATLFTSIAGVSTTELQRLSLIGTTLADTTGIQSEIVMTPATVGSVRLLIGAPQIEQATAVSTPILPAVGVPLASTRTPDTLSWSLATLGIGPDGKGTYLWKGTLAEIQTGSTQILLQVDAGASANRYMLSQAPSSNQTTVTRTVANVGSAANPGSVAAGASISIGMVIDGTGGAKASLAGAPVVSVTGGVTAGLTTLRIGTSTVSGLPMSGEVARVDVMAGVILSDTELQAAVLAL